MWQQSRAERRILLGSPKRPSGGSWTPGPALGPAKLRRIQYCRAPRERWTVAEAGLEEPWWRRETRVGNRIRLRLLQGIYSKGDRGTTEHVGKRMREDSRDARPPREAAAVTVLGASARMPNNASTNARLSRDASNVNHSSPLPGVACVPSLSSVPLDSPAYLDVAIYSNPYPAPATAVYLGPHARTFAAT